MTEDSAAPHDVHGAPETKPSVPRPAVPELAAAPPVTGVALLLELERIEADEFGEKLMRRLVLIEAFAELVRGEALRGVPLGRA